MNTTITIAAFAAVALTLAGCGKAPKDALPQAKPDGGGSTTWHVGPPLPRIPGQPAYGIIYDPGIPVDPKAKDAWKTYANPNRHDVRKFEIKSSDGKVVKGKVDMACNTAKVETSVEGDGDRRIVGMATSMVLAGICSPRGAPGLAMTHDEAMAKAMTPPAGMALPSRAAPFQPMPKTDGAR